MNKRFFFPQPKRSFTGQRWLRISLRTWHLLGIAFLVGQTAQGVAFAQQPIALWSTFLSGAFFIGVELYQSCVFLVQLKGLAVIVKTVFLAWAVAYPGYALDFFVAAIVIGGISSHMPGKYRYFSWLHGEERKE